MMENNKKIAHGVQSRLGLGSWCLALVLIISVLADTSHSLLAAIVPGSSQWTGRVSGPVAELVTTTKNILSIEIRQS